MFYLPLFKEQFLEFYHCNNLISILLRCLELTLLVRMSNVQTHCNLNLTQNEEYALLDL